MINITIDSGDIIASLALLFSVYATFKTLQFNNRQQELIKSQAKLNQLLLDKETAVVEMDKQADLGATILKLGSNKYRLKIFNKGKVAARQITIAFPEGNEIVPESEIDRKFPLQLLDVHQSVELIASVHMRTKSKHLVQLKWQDDRIDQAVKDLWVTI